MSDYWTGQLNAAGYGGLAPGTEILLGSQAWDEYLQRHQMNQIGPNVPSSWIAPPPPKRPLPTWALAAVALVLSAVDLRAAE